MTTYAIWALPERSHAHVLGSSPAVSKRRMASDRDGFGSSSRICGSLAAGALEAQVGGWRQSVLIQRSAPHSDEAQLDAAHRAESYEHAYSETRGDVGLA
jgi:hypothetical protein